MFFQSEKLKLEINSGSVLEGGIEGRMLSRRESHAFMICMILMQFIITRQAVSFLIFMQ